MRWANDAQAGGDTQRANQMADPLFGLQRITHINIDDGATMSHAWGGDGDRL